MKRYVKSDGKKNKRVIKCSQDVASFESEYEYPRYDSLDALNCFQNFVYNYSDSDMYIADAISEQADYSVDVYYDQLCKSCWDLYQSGAYEEAKANGILDGTDDLMQVLQICQSEFYTIQMYQNLDALMRNLVLEYLNTNDIFDESPITYEQWQEVCDELLTDVDNNDRISDICERVADYIRDNSDSDEDEDEE